MYCADCAVCSFGLKLFQQKVQDLLISCPASQGECIDMKMMNVLYSRDKLTIRIKCCQVEIMLMYLGQHHYVHCIAFSVVRCCQDGTN